MVSHVPRPKRIGWHIASFLNALIAWGLYLFADSLLARHARASESQSVKPWIGTAVSVTLFVRGVLSLYTIACVFYITASLAPNIDWPPLESKLFPW